MDPDRRPAMRRAAEWVAAKLAFAGARVVETDGHPVVLAERIVSPGAPTILVYGHYDVQPPGDEDAWTTPPFAPDVRDGRLYGRGASDDKGPVVVALETARRFHERGEQGLNVRFLIEGEEEIGSPNLPAFLAAHARRARGRPGRVGRRRDVAAERALGRDRGQGAGRARPGRHRTGERLAFGPPRRCRAEPEPCARPDRREPARRRRQGRRGRLLRRRRRARDRRPRGARTGAVRRRRVPARGRGARAARRARPLDAGAALGAPHARGERAPRRRRLHGDPARGARPHHLPARPAPGSRPHLRPDRRARRRRVSAGRGGDGRGTRRGSARIHDPC